MQIGFVSVRVDINYIFVHALGRLAANREQIIIQVDLEQQVHIAGEDNFNMQIVKSSGLDALFAWSLFISMAIWDIDSMNNSSRGTINLGEVTGKMVSVVVWNSLLKLSAIPAGYLMVGPRLGNDSFWWETFFFDFIKDQMDFLLCLFMKSWLTNSP